jgi:hypothetical protein
MTSLRSKLVALLQNNKEFCISGKSVHVGLYAFEEN